MATPERGGDIDDMPSAELNLPAHVASSETGDNPYYRTGEWLRAKHQQTRFDSGRRFERWALGLVPVSPEWRVLDAGCGWGRFTWSLIDDGLVLPEHMLCCDRSEGMLLTVQEEARRRQLQIASCVADIAALPLPPQVVDLVIAGHVFYHVDDIERGVRELARVTKDDGWALVTTNSDAIDPLVIDLHERALSALDIPFVPEGPSRFSMENGRDSLTRAFGAIEIHVFGDTITFPDVQTFVDAYITIGTYRTLMEDQTVPREKRERLAAEVAAQAARVLETTGTLRADVLMGAFVCRDPIR